MKTLILYHSQTGFTRRYAELLAQRLQCSAEALEAKPTLDAYECVIFGSWVCAGSIQKLNPFKRMLPSMAGKRIIVFAVGSTPPGMTDAAEQIFARAFTPEERKSIRTFYLQGGLNYERMRGAHRLLLRLLCHMLRGKKQPTEEEKAMLQTLSGSFDAVDERSIEPIVEAARGGTEANNGRAKAD